MRPIYHPKAADITVEGILHALSDPVRMQIFSRIAQAGCSQICASFLVVKGKKMAKSTLSQHFRILREAGLIRSSREGVELHNVTRCKDLKDRFGPMVENIVKAYATQHAREKKFPAGS